MRRYAPIILVSLVCSLLTLGLYHYLILPQITEDLVQFVEPTKAGFDTPLNSKPFFAPPVENEKFINISETAINGVVSVKATKLKESGFFRDKYAKTNGSGVILSDDGYIVTNYHVIQDAADIDVRLEDKREYKAEMVGFDLATDIALIKIEAENLFHLEFGNSDSLRVGEWVLAVGNPFKLQSSVTAGIVSAKGRNINIFDRQGIESFIQTDAAINPGNSGGALINTSGKVVGINTAILTYSGKYEGFSFAAPSNLVNKIVKDIRNYGAVQRAWLGVSVFDIDNDKAEDLDLDFIGGVLLDVVDKNGAAANAGMKSDDVIISIDGSRTLTTSEFLEVLGRFSPGDRVEVEYVRKSKVYTRYT
ncbi:MAG: trypsin-like serine protease [Saprospiraceae bacterium]|nr:trypsin-like serine protease [Saprospiraceae bacterium]